MGEKATFDKEKNIIRVETAERECFCPMFDSKKVSKSICQCSVGWQSQTYETILGQTVEAKCVESVIRGSKKCVFEIKLIKSQRLDSCIYLILKEKIKNTTTARFYRVGIKYLPCL